jgi:hypothetical protein
VLRFVLSFILSLIALFYFSAMLASDILTNDLTIIALVGAVAVGFGVPFYFAHRAFSGAWRAPATVVVFLVLGGACVMGATLGEDLCTSGSGSAANMCLFDACAETFSHLECQKTGAVGKLLISIRCATAKPFYIQVSRSAIECYGG